MILVSCGANAADRDAPISPQPLSSALVEFSEKWQLQVVYLTEVAAGVSCRGAAGNDSPEADLDQLLAETGLKYEFINRRTVAIDNADQVGDATAERLPTQDVTESPLPDGESGNDDGTNRFAAAATATLVDESSGNIVDRTADTHAGALEEVTVTARRREERLQDLPLSVAAISAQDMQTQGIYNTRDIGEFIPNVSLKESTPGSSLVFIRGIGGGGSDPSFSYGSGMYIDGHYVPYSRGGFMSTLDVDRIEVLRGPQGTLFGKNTTGGAINVISAKPGPEFDSSLTARIGDYGQQDLWGMLNFPISDRVFARISVASEEYDGHWYNPTLSRDGGYSDLTAIRAALRFEPGDWIIDAAISTVENDNENRQAQCAPDPAGPFGLAFAVGDPGQAQAYAGCADATRAYGPYVSSSELDTYSNFETATASVQAAWNSGGAVGALDNLTITTSLSYRKMQNVWFSDGDYTPQTISYFRVDSGDGRGTLSETKAFEMLFEGDVNERLSFMVGTWFFDNLTDDAQGYDCKDYFDENYDPVLDNDVICPEQYEQVGPFIALTPVAGGAPLGSASGLIQSALQENSRAIFGHMTYALNDLWDVELGIRYTEDDRDWYNIETRVSNLVNVPGPVANFDVIMNQQTLFIDGWYGQDKATFSGTTPLVSLIRSLDGISNIGSGNLYFLISEGYLTGAFNSEIPNNIPEIQQFRRIQPESVRNYEVGFKGTFANGRLRLNSALFYMDYRDKQVEVILDNADGRFGNTGPELEVLTNAATAEIYGFEAELAALPWDGGSLRLDVGYLVNKYGKFESFDPAVGTVDLSNTVIADLTANWTVNASLEHTFQLGNGARLTPMLGVYWQSDYDWRPPGTPGRDPHDGACKQDSYSKFRARLKYELPGGSSAISLFGRNIGDEFILANCGYSFGLNVKTWEPPVYWGLEFTTRWGRQ